MTSLRSTPHLLTDRVLDKYVVITQAKASGLFLETCHSPDHLCFASPDSFNEETQQLQSFLASSTPYTSDNSSLHSSHGSTDSYGPCTPRRQLYTPGAASCLNRPCLEHDQLQFMPLANLHDPAASLKPIPSTHPGMTSPVQDLRLHQHTSAGAPPMAMLQHPDVASHLRDFSSCFASGAAEKHVARVLESQASGSPSQSWNSSTPSCHSTNTRGAEGSPKVSRPTALTLLHGSHSSVLARGTVIVNMQPTSADMGSTMLY